MTPISVADLHHRLDAPDLTIVDVRTLAAYNGWRRNGEARGGHLPGAVSFPAAWLETVDEPEIERLLPTKRDPAGNEIVVYGDGDLDAAAVAVKFSEPRGLVGARAPGRGDCPGCRARPAARTPPQLRQARAHPVAARRPRRPHARGSAQRDVPAVPRQLRRAGGVRRGPHPGRALPRHQLARGPRRLEPALARGDRRPPWSRSVSPTTRRSWSTAATPRDDANEKWPGRRAGQIAATRALMIMRYAGVDDVRLLDGGYDWWVQGGNTVETVERPPSPVDVIRRQPCRSRPEVIVDIDEAKEILADPDGAALVSVRTWREHIGNVSGYNYIGPAGRIKGDVWGNCGTDAYHMQHYRNIDNTMRAYPEIAANWAEAGITPDKWVAFYCGTGWRASETWFYAYLQGWERIAVYDGGWFEWSQDPINNPIEIGEPGDEAAA